jgi:DNA-binding response OmpR family regulator
VPTVLLATDADWIYDEVEAALADAHTTVHRVRAGVDVIAACLQVVPDLVVLDLQIGNMGGMAACLAIRHEEEADRLPTTGVIMLLDRTADVFLARRCDADGWLVKPLDAFRLHEAAQVVLAGGDYHDGEPADEAAPDDLAEPAAT